MNGDFMMSLNLVPDYCFQSFDEADVDFFIKNNLKGVILDIDNTLEPYENPRPGERVIAWYTKLREKGISMAIVSNNGSSRVATFYEELGLTCFCRAKKPFPRNIRKAISAMGLTPNDVIFIGDQILTDVWGAHNAGIPAILVPPINDKKDIFTRFKRLIEKRYIKKYNKINGKVEKKA
jgi:HAD superfamily phosphatase (TIGR01668 family)